MQNTGYRCLWLLLIGLLGMTPVVQAQSSPTVNNLLVEIWPEFDRPEVLVIYRGQLSQETPLPSEISFPLPGHIEAMHVVATEQNGSLFEVDRAAVELRQEREVTIVTFPVTAPGFQLEYYDPLILSREGAERTLIFEFSTLLPIEMVTFEVQEPFQATNFSMTPQAEDSFVGENGLRYNTIGRANIVAGEPVNLSATYQRQTDELSAPNLAPADTPPQLEAATAAVPDNDLRFGYVLIGIGSVLLLFAAGSWWWTRRRMAGSDVPRRRPARPKAKRPSPKAVSAQVPATQGNKFCYRCGTSLRDDAKFCHQCGAERRYE